MSLIEGVGDEVTQFLTAVFVVVVATFAWRSTNARPDRYRTVLLMRSRNQHPITVNLLTRHNITSSTITLPTTSGPTVNQPNQPTMENIPEETTTVEGQASNDQIREMDSIVNAMEGEVSTGSSVFARSNDESNPGTDDKKKDDKPTGEESSDNADNASAVPPAPEDNGEKILIKLKYINDTSKEVDGSLDELLKDFKRRHFASELCAERHVRLIFRGRVLADEAATLRACGLHDRAVVHCLVHARRARARAPAAPAPPSAPSLAPAGAQPAAEIVQEVIADPPQPERTWDLENILMTLVSVSLTVVWFFRCEYSSMFTASASVALFGLTVFYSVAIFGLYLSDTFHFERRPTHPVPPS